MSDPEAKAIAVRQPVLDGTVMEAAAELPPEVAAVAATLQTVAGWVPEDDRDMFYEAAKQTERGWDGTCCPVCEEVTCDSGCPLEKIRAVRFADRYGWARPT